MFSTHQSSPTVLQWYNNLKLLTALQLHVNMLFEQVVARMTGNWLFICVKVMVTLEVQVCEREILMTKGK